MCGRYSLYHPEETLNTHFAVAFRALEPTYNLSPTQNVPFVFQNADDDRQAGRARWGLVPQWRKEGASGKPLFNARSETVLEKPTFKQAFIRGRCLVPASGWFEWQRRDGRKQPFFFKLKTAEPLAFAGLFDVWRSEDGSSRLVSLCVLTTEAAPELAEIHERMPVILDFDDYDLWLDRSTPDIADLTELLRPYPSEQLEVYPVSAEVNQARTEGPGLVQRVELPGVRA